MVIGWTQLSAAVAKSLERSNSSVYSTHRLHFSYFVLFSVYSLVVMSGLAVQEDRNQEATCYVGNLDPRVTEALLWELMLQAGPVCMYTVGIIVIGSERVYTQR